jgi:hypothetical protein
VFVCEILDVCGGVISGAGHTGSVTQFCTKPVGTCHTKGHRQKVLIENNTFYIKHSSAGQARFEPSLPKNLMPDVLEVEDLMSKDKHFVEWSAYFSGLKAKGLAEPPGSSGTAKSWEKLKTPVLEA